jgi:hypothetical protein
MTCKLPPYTTPSGLKIGCRYEAPSRMPAPSRDALLLQSALLEKRSPTPLWAQVIWRWL